MNAIKTTYLASVLALLAACLTAAPTRASDIKMLSAMQCQPRTPNTGATDLVYNSDGIFNSGTTGAWVICELPMDSETGYAVTPGRSGYVDIIYATGMIPGRVACTLVAGSERMQTGPIYSDTYAPINRPANIMNWLQLSLSYPSTSSGFTHVPITVTCVLSPKTTLIALYFREDNPTFTHFSLPAEPAVPLDVKSLAAVQCRPMGPDTTAGELTYNHTGIHNPGTTNEWVVCELPMDAEASYWGAYVADEGHADVYYSSGLVGGRVACTNFVGSEAMQTTPIYSRTVAPSRSPPDTRTFLTFPLRSNVSKTSPSTYEMRSNTIECLLTPKTTLVGIYFRESGFLTDWTSGRPAFH